MRQLPDFPIQIFTRKVSGGPKINIYYPHVFQMQNKALEKFINQSIVQKTQSLIDKQIAGAPSVIVEMVGTYEIKNNQRNVLSFTFSNYTYPDNAAHGMTYLNALTFDLNRGQKCTLNQLFEPESNYLDKLSALIKEQMEERNIPLINDFAGIQSDQPFYIADKTIVIFFQLYEYTPYAYGFPMFPISVYEVQDIIKEDGPLGRMAENR